MKNKFMKLLWFYGLDFYKGVDSLLIQSYSECIYTADSRILISQKDEGFPSYSVAFYI